MPFHSPTRETKHQHGSYWWPSWEHWRPAAHSTVTMGVVIVQMVSGGTLEGVGGPPSALWWPWAQLQWPIAVRGKSHAICPYISQLDSLKAKTRGKQKDREKTMLCLAQCVMGSCLTCLGQAIHIVHYELKDILTEQFQCSQKDLLKDLMFYWWSFPYRKHLCFTILQNTL